MKGSPGAIHHGAVTNRHVGREVKTHTQATAAGGIQEAHRFQKGTLPETPNLGPVVHFNPFGVIFRWLKR